MRFASIKGIISAHIWCTGAIVKSAGAMVKMHSLREREFATRYVLAYKCKCISLSYISELIQPNSKHQCVSVIILSYLSWWEQHSALRPGYIVCTGSRTVGFSERICSESPWEPWAAVRWWCWLLSSTIFKRSRPETAPFTESFDRGCCIERFVAVMIALKLLIYVI